MLHESISHLLLALSTGRLPTDLFLAVLRKMASGALSPAEAYVELCPDAALLDVEGEIELDDAPDEPLYAALDICRDNVPAQRMITAALVADYVDAEDLFGEEFPELDLLLSAASADEIAEIACDAAKM